MNIDLDAIQNRSDDAMMHESLEPGSYAEIAWHSARDVPALLAYARDLEARIGRVDELHLSSGGHNPKCQCGIPAGDGATCLECGDIWPCPTIAALTATEGAA